MSNSDRNNPKPLPDDFGMTMPNIRPSNSSQQNQPDDFDMTTPNIRPPQPNPARTPPPQPDDFGMTMAGYQPQRANQPAPPADDYGMTTPNLQMPNNYNSPPQSSDNFDLTMANARSSATPSEPDFGLTMPGNNQYSSRSSEPDFGATMPYIAMPEQMRREAVRESVAAQPPPQQKPEQKRKGGIPIWAWLLGAGTAFLAFLAVAGLAAYFFLWRDTGFTLVVKGAPPGSTVFVDGTRRGVTSADGSTRILGIKADDKRNIKVTREGYTEYNDVIQGKDGETLERIAQMRKIETTPEVVKPSDCQGQDPRVCEAEQRAMDALDKLKSPFTADELVAALNLHIINFESGKSDIPPAREQFLRKAAEKAKQLPQTTKIEIGGHTDNVGGAAPNQALSEDRAKAVRTMLVAFGVNSNMLATRGYGSAKPKTQNTTEEGKFQNRRIEYSVLAR